MLALFYENSELQFLVLMGELGVYGQYQLQGNRRVHEAYSSTLNIFDDEAEMTELPHVQRAPLLLLNGQMHEWHETNKMWRREAAITVPLSRSVTDLRYLMDGKLLSYRGG